MAPEWRWLLAKLLLVVAVMSSAVAIIYTSHSNRLVFNALQKAVVERDELEVEWGQLLLEQSALAAHSEVEKKARTQLGMRVPDASEIVLVRE